MTSEEIIERLLDQKHITVKEAMILLKDLIKNRYFSNDDLISKFPTTTPSNPWSDRTTVVMYGVQTPDSTRWNDAQSNITTSVSNTFASSVKK